MHVRRNCLDAEGHYVDPEFYQPIARLHADNYVTSDRQSVLKARLSAISRSRNSRLKSLGNENTIMHIRLINPNSTDSMTAQALESALLVKHDRTLISSANPTDTPVSIEGYADEAMAIPGMLAEIRKGEALGWTLML